METISSIFAPLIGPVTWALVHFVWQGSAVALALAIVLALIRRDRAVLRYRLACCALAAMVALPVATALRYEGPRFGAADGGEPPASSWRAPGSPSRPSAAVPAVLESDRASRTRDGFRSIQALRPWVFAAWLAGVLALSLFNVGGWRRIQRLKRIGINPAPDEWRETTARLCRLMGISRAVRVLQSVCVEVPTVIGWLSPVLLIPVSAFAGLSPEQLRDIVVHELAHIKRRDYLVNLLQVVAETLLFFHPAVWWVSRRIREERENCCDDFAVVMCQDRAAYAEALVRLEEIRMLHPQFSMRADGGSLASRIHRLVGGVKMSNYRKNRPWLTGAFLASLLVVGAAALSLAVDYPGQGKKEKQSSRANTAGGSYSTVEENFALEGKWEIERYGGVPVLQVEVRERKNRFTMSIDFNQDEFTGLDFGDGDEFELHRDAGSFYFVGDFEGSGQKVEGDGRFGFVPNDDFDEMVGGGDFDDHDLFILAAEDVGVDYVNRMKELGYDRMDGDDLVPLAIHGVSLEFVEEMRKLGYNVSLDRLVQFRIHGVSPEFIREMADLGYDHVSAGDLVKWRIHGVSPEFVRAMREAGVEPLSSADLVRMRIHGVSPEFVSGMAAAGYESLDSDVLVKWRIHGVSPEFVQGMKDAGVGHMDVDDLTRMRIHGVSPEFVRELEALGYSNVDVDDLVRMRIHGVSPGYIRNVLSKVKEPPSVDDLVKMKIHGIHL
jgi:beta-lactamase regulating signal transducer with metallopeptidase domain